MYKDKNPFFSSFGFRVLLKLKMRMEPDFLKKIKKNTTFVQREEKKGKRKHFAGGRRRRPESRSMGASEVEVVLVSW